MELNQLFKVQKIMEDNIKNLTDIQEDSLGEENVFYLRFLALQVKTSEIANLTKCYKYYRIKRSIPKEKIIIRYIDAMKFLLSIGNAYNFNIIDEQAIQAISKSDNIIKLFSDIMDDIKELKDDIIKDNYIGSLQKYIRLFARYVNLAECLGLNFQQVYNYYLKYNHLEDIGK